MERESFIFYRSFASIKALKAKERDWMVWALIDYALDWKEPDWNKAPNRDILQILWAQIKPVIDANNRKYSTSKEKTPEQLWYSSCLKKPIYQEDYDSIKRMVFEGEKPPRLVSWKLKRMKYSDYLETVYWRVVSEYIKHIKGGICADCGASGSLDVHHLNYKHIGSELNHLEDLVCLCRSCHQKRHTNEK